VLAALVGPVCLPKGVYPALTSFEFYVIIPLAICQFIGGPSTPISLINSKASIFNCFGYSNGLPLFFDAGEDFMLPATDSAFLQLLSNTDDE